MKNIQGGLRRLILNDFLVIMGIGFIDHNDYLSLWIWTEETEEEYPFCIGLLETKEGGLNQIDI